MDTEPLAAQYFWALQAFLYKNARAGTVSAPLLEDLIARLNNVFVSDAFLDTRPETTTRRLTWCLHTAMDLLLKDLGVPLPPVPPEKRPAVTQPLLEGLLPPIDKLMDSLLIDQAEYSMGSAEDQVGSAQLWRDKLGHRSRAVELLRTVVTEAQNYLQEKPDAAAQAGIWFHRFLLEMGLGRDELLALGEGLLKVHA